MTGGADPLEGAQAALSPAYQEDVCRLMFTGARGAEPLDLEGLERKLAGRCWALSLRDRTRAGRDLWARMEEDSLTGAVSPLPWPPDVKRSRTTICSSRRCASAWPPLENGEDIAP